jgi:hypothetical protein
MLQQSSSPPATAGWDHRLLPISRKLRLPAPLLVPVTPRTFPTAGRGHGERQAASSLRTAEATASNISSPQWQSVFL